MLISRFTFVSQGIHCGDGAAEVIIAPGSRDETGVGRIAS
jgi:hypothetical protein